MKDLDLKRTVKRGPVLNEGRRLLLSFHPSTEPGRPIFLYITRASPDDTALPIFKPMLFLPRVGYAK